MPGRKQEGTGAEAGAEAGVRWFGYAELKQQWVEEPVAEMAGVVGRGLQAV